MYFSSSHGAGCGILSGVGEVGGDCRLAGGSGWTRRRVTGFFRTGGRKVGQGQGRLQLSFLKPTRSFGESGQPWVGLGQPE